MSKHVAIIMGSDSDWPVMEAAAKVLDECGISYEATVVSAHRTPDEMMAFATGAASAGFKVVIAGAGGAAHLPGMVAAATTLPVIGVPVPLKYLDGMDSLLSIVQMPAGIPVATVGIGNAKNAGLLAARIIGSSDTSVAAKVAELMESAKEESLSKRVPKL
jgi:5-(carboxyamino)imidazole ribonucleotide mutase